MVVLMRNQNGRKINQQNIPEYDKYGKYDELCSIIHLSSDQIWIYEVI